MDDIFAAFFSQANLTILILHNVVVQSNKPFIPCLAATEKRKSFLNKRSFPENIGNISKQTSTFLWYQKSNSAISILLSALAFVM